MHCLINLINISGTFHKVDFSTVGITCHPVRNQPYSRPEAVCFTHLHTCIDTPGRPCFGRAYIGMPILRFRVVQVPVILPYSSGHISVEDGITDIFSVAFACGLCFPVRSALCPKVDGAFGNGDKILACAIVVHGCIRSLRLWTHISSMIPVGAGELVVPTKRPAAGRTIGIVRSNIVGQHDMVILRGASPFAGNGLGTSGYRRGEHAYIVRIGIIIV